MFKKAERKKAKLRLALAGASYSGKTWSSLLIATGMGGKIALIDTERRAHLYGDDFDFDNWEMPPPYSPDEYIKRIHIAEKAGYDILIIDSLSHAWSGEGGVLDIVAKAGGQFQKGWDRGTPAQNKLINAIMTSSMHIIACIRSKVEHVLESSVNKEGRTVMAPKKVGMAPVQRADLEYEFTMWMEMGAENIAHITKDNTRLYGDDFIKPTKKMGEDLLSWLNSGKEEMQIADDEPADPEGSRIINSMQKELTLANGDVLDGHIDGIILTISKCQTLESLKEEFTAAYSSLKKHPRISEIVAEKERIKAFIIDSQEKTTKETNHE